MRLVYRCSAPLPLSPLATRGTRFGCQRLYGQLDISRNLEKAAFISRDGVTGHTEFPCEFLLSETEEEPLFSKLPTGQNWR